MKYKLINLTGHPIKIQSQDAIVEIPCSGKLRARYETQCLGPLKTDHGIIELTKNYYLRLPYMPKQRNNTYYLVSRLIAELYPERGDLLIVNGLKKENGKVIYCRSLAKL